MKKGQTGLVSENLVWKVAANLEKNIDVKFDELDKKSEKRFDKVMTYLTGISRIGYASLN